MSLRTRRMIVLVFILLFLISTPIVLLYGTGHRYNFKKRKIERIGAFVFATDPKVTDITINDKVYHKKNDSLVLNYLPDLYAVRVNKEGYHDWHKTIEIKPGVSTLINDINLFKSQISELLYHGQATQSLFDHNTTKVAYVSGNEVAIYDLSTNINEIVYKLNAEENVMGLWWNSDNTKLALQIKHKYRANPSVVIITYLAETPPVRLDPVTQFAWHPYLNNNLYTLFNNQLVQIDLNTNTQSVIYSQPELTYFAVEDNIYVISANQEKNKNYLYSVSLDDKDQTRFINTFPLTKSLSIELSSNGQILLHDDKHALLYFIDPNKHLESSVLDLMYNADHCIGHDNNYICHNDFEIWYYDLNNGKRDLINRFSQTIKQIYLLNTGTHLLAHIDNSLQLIDLNYGTITELAQLDLIENVELNADNTQVYFYGQVGNQAGIYSLEIR